MGVDERVAATIKGLCTRSQQIVSSTVFCLFSVCRRHVVLSLTPKCKLSHLFLSPAVNQWIKERVKHDKCAKQWIKDWDWRKRSGNYKNENKSPRHKAQQKCTHHKHSCLERFVLLRKSFQFFLRNLLDFDLLVVSKYFTIQNQVRTYNEKNTRNTNRSY